jgi:hypothetical protein
LVATRLLVLLLRVLPLPDRLLAIIDDTPTQRYGPQVEGADIHRKPTPSPADRRRDSGGDRAGGARLVPFFSTDPNATAVEILEAFARRAAIEQTFHDVKEVWGAGQEQVRDIWTNLAERRNALRGQIMQHEFSTLAAVGRLPRKIVRWAQRQIALAC